MAQTALVGSPTLAPRRRGPVILAPGLAVLVLVAAALLGFVLAVTGGQLGCLGGGSPPGPAPSRSAHAEIPPRYLRLYQQAGRRFQIDWTFLASIGAQETDHGRAPLTRSVNSAGCAGPMQIGVGGRCGDIWDQYKTDGNGDRRTDVNDPADAIYTAARILRRAKHAPPTGGSYAAYRQAACNYYGACADAAANYADEVMARAVQYGFHGSGSPAATNVAQGQPAAQPGPGAGGCGAGGAIAGGAGVPGPVRKLYRPRRLEPLPAVAVAPGSGLISCDARIVSDVAYLTRRYRVWVTACYAIHAPDGEHPLGAAVDLVPADGNWARTLKLAHALGWSESCAASGVAPACAKPPFRFIGYNGFPNHGDPAHCTPCSGGPHLHLSWLTSSSPGEPGNRPRSSYSPATWVEAFTAPGAGAPKGRHA